MDITEKPIGPPVAPAVQPKKKRIPYREERAVARGAAWRDKNHPGWAERINLTTLRMDQCSKCIVGQLGIEAPWDKPMAKTLIDFDKPISVIRGFNTGAAVETSDEASKRSWGLLAMFWEREIIKRRGTP